MARRVVAHRAVLGVDKVNAEPSRRRGVRHLFPLLLLLLLLLLRRTGAFDQRGIARFFVLAVVLLPLLFVLLIRALCRIILLRALAQVEAPRAQAHRAHHSLRKLSSFGFRFRYVGGRHIDTRLDDFDPLVEGGLSPHGSDSSLEEANHAHAVHLVAHHPGGAVE